MADITTHTSISIPATKSTNEQSRARLSQRSPHRQGMLTAVITHLLESAEPNTATRDALNKALAMGVGIADDTDVFAVEKVERLPKPEQNGHGASIKISPH